MQACGADVYALHARTHACSNANVSYLAISPGERAPVSLLSCVSSLFPIFISLSLSRLPSHYHPNPSNPPRSSHPISSFEMQVSGSTRQEKDWSAFIPNGGFGVKRPPRLIGLGPSPTAVNFLQEELGHNPTPETINSSFFNRHPQLSKFSTHGGKGPSHAELRSDFEMRELMSLTGSPMVEAGDFGCSPPKDSQEGRAIRALADLFMCPATTFPLSVGLFYDTVSTANASNHQSSSLKQLEGEVL
ncbi:hypothetical protein EGR_07005 [Echinococcus granulosus]|uniref:Uncharacterized protein n=1 Tax=Echinococcus granulosus TaxID=6210 RepID=W6UAI2_ECHGR|nr:hypothetical protein EGR_07005 [Echinococcus granulosus]EUB58085.1 hypothetical protein EGR_07005 [Echinococcus granulosus]